MTMRSFGVVCGLGLALCAAEGIASWQASAGADRSIVASLWLRMGGLFAFGLSYAFAPATLRSVVERAAVRTGAAWNQRPFLWAAVIAVATYAAFQALTPRIAFGLGAAGLGYGHDGLVYGAMVEHFGDPALRPDASMNYRILLPAIASALGLDPFTAFGLFNALAHFASCALVLRLAILMGAGEARAVAWVGAFATLAFGSRFFVYYPLLMDGVGLAFLLVFVVGALERRPLVCALVLSLATIHRENLVVLAPFAVLAGAREERVQWTLWMLVPFVAFALSRAFPVVLPMEGGRTALGEIVRWVEVAFTTPDRLVRIVLAHGIALGPLLGWAVLRGGQAAAFARAHPEWAYFVVVTFAASAFGGHDVERIAVGQFPALIAWLSFGRASRADRTGERSWLAVHLAALQLVAMGVFLRWDPSEVYYLSLFASHVPAQHFAPMLLLGTTVLVLPVLLGLARDAEPERASD